MSLSLFFSRGTITNRDTGTYYKYELQICLGSLKRFVLLVHIYFNKTCDFIVNILTAQLIVESTRESIVIDSTYIR